MTIRNVTLGATLLLAATAIGCGSSPRSMAGVAPSAFGTIAAASSDGSGSFGTLKDGHDKGKPAMPGTPVAGTPPVTSPVPDADDKDGHGHDNEGPGEDARDGHGNGPQLQVEGIATSVIGTCPALTIVIGTRTITTDATTDFQRADCAQIVTGDRLHIDARTTTTTTTTTTGTTTTTSFVASYVRRQGPTHEDGDDNDAGDDDVTPPAPTAPAPTAPK